MKTKATNQGRTKVCKDEEVVSHFATASPPHGTHPQMLLRLGHWLRGDKETSSQQNDSNSPGAGLQEPMPRNSMPLRQSGPGRSHLDRPCHLSRPRPVFQSRPGRTFSWARQPRIQPRARGWVWGSGWAGNRLLLARVNSSSCRPTGTRSTRAHILSHLFFLLSVKRGGSRPIKKSLSENTHIFSTIFDYFGPFFSSRGGVLPNPKNPYQKKMRWSKKGEGVGSQFFFWLKQFFMPPLNP